MAENFAFPHDEIDALSLLYIQHQDLSGLAPEEIYEKYKDCHKAIPIFNQIILHNRLMRFI